MSRRQNVTSGCWRTQWAAASSPRSAQWDTTSGAKMPSADEVCVGTQVKALGADGAAQREGVDRHLGVTALAEGLDRRDGGLEVPGAGVVPVDQASVGPPGQERQVRVVSRVVEVVQAEDREPQSGCQPALPGPRGAGEDDDAGWHAH